MSVGINTESGTNDTGGISSVSLTYNDSKKEGITRATIGEGNITIDSQVSDGEGINRDITKAQEVTIDEGMNVTVNVPIELIKNPAKYFEDSNKRIRELPSSIKKLPAIVRENFDSIQEIFAKEVEYGSCKTTACKVYVGEITVEGQIGDDGQFEISAYFANRPLEDMPWLGYLSNNPTDDKANLEIAHEQLFFEDAKGGNIGFFGDGTVRSDSPALLGGYRKTKTGFDDALIREAVKNIVPKPYSLMGSSSCQKYNCQDWAEDVRHEYRRLENLNNK